MVLVGAVTIDSVCQGPWLGPIARPPVSCLVPISYAEPINHLGMHGGLLQRIEYLLASDQVPVVLLVDISAL